MPHENGLHYHVVFVPNVKSKRIYRAIWKRLGLVFEKVAEKVKWEVVESRFRPDHVHLRVIISPKYAVSDVIGSLKGLSATIITRNLGGSNPQITSKNV